MSFPIEIERTFREHWPTSLAALAIPARSIDLALEDVEALGAYTPEFRDAVFGEVTRRKLSSDFFSAINAAIAKARGAVFPRLGYCSWKTSSPCALPARNAQEVLETITRPDARVARALLVAVATQSSVALHLVDWREIPAWSEFRLFIRNRRLVGATQYHCNRAFPELGTVGSALRVEIRRFAEALASAIHMANAVADIYLAPDKNGGLKAELIELNPFSPQTGSGLFSWDRGADFDGSIRLVDGGQNASGLASLS